MAKKKRPPLTKMFLYRQGLHLIPSDNFVQTFKKHYMEILRKARRYDHVEDLDDETAKFFIMVMAESIIYCLDAGFDIWFFRIMVFMQKLSDYRDNVKRRIKQGTSKVRENIKKITIKPIFRSTLKIKDLMNKDNKPYQDFIQQKKSNFKKIKEYYKEFYGKQEDWWQTQH